MPLDLRPLPVPSQDPSILPALLYSHTIYARFGAYMPSRRFSREPVPESSAPYPPWDMALETHWQKIHPDAWNILEKDDKQDWEEFVRLEKDLRKARAEGDISPAEEQAARQLMVTLRDRIILRASRLFALHQVRKAVLAQANASEPALLRDLLRDLPAGDFDHLLSSPSGSLWPLPSIPPPRHDLTLVNQINSASYRVPLYPSAAFDSILAQAAADESSPSDKPLQTLMWPPSPPDEKLLEAERQLRRRKGLRPEGESAHQK
ncbi:hypothetical protein JCM11251_002707 [Rhodosporidiobolus azoricus]